MTPEQRAVLEAQIRIEAHRRSATSYYLPEPQRQQALNDFRRWVTLLTGPCPP